MAAINGHIKEILVLEAALEEWNGADSGFDFDSDHAARLWRKSTA